AFGSALARLVADSGRDVVLHGDADRLAGATFAPRVRATSDLAEVARACRLLLLAVPSPRVPDIIRGLGEVTSRRHLLVHALGAPAVGRPVPDIARHETPIKRIGVLAGPALAKDLAERRPCAVVVASSFDEVIAATRTALDVPAALHVYGSHD